jgi:hypothetical protein
VSASESGERPESAERSPTEPELTPRARLASASARLAGADGLRAWCPPRPAPHEAGAGLHAPGRDRRIIGIAVVLGAVLVGQDGAGWIVGLAVGLTSVVLAALLWSSRQL